MENEAQGLVLGAALFSRALGRAAMTGCTFSHMFLLSYLLGVMAVFGIFIVSNTSPQFVEAMEKIAMSKHLISYS